ncbi:MAG: PIN domain-containing protein [Methylocystis sp.]|nr:PIN domain-containing protein [Methylocystis sp.]MBI3275173.1 PIN domain-containing protein [Methylocystis sp.]
MNERIRHASKIYFDANAIIYFFERADALQKAIARVIEHAVHANIPLVASEIGVAECLHGAYKLDSPALEREYLETFYELRMFELVSVDDDSLKRAARLGAYKGLKLVDALHFLAAIETNSTVFLTNDARFRASHGVEVVDTRDL